jgi:DNA-binding transcriptional LysR family regulator
MLDLNDFRYFVEVVDRGGFSAAARSLERPTSTVSYRIQQLERSLGLTLLTRTSRHTTMTESGERFYGQAVATLECAAEAEAVMRDLSTEVAGTVRYTVAAVTSQFAMPEMLLGFLARYPQVRLVQHSCDTKVDILADRYDLAIRMHARPLPNSRLVQRPLAEAPWHLFAAPGYLAEFGTPGSPSELEHHNTLFMKHDHLEPALRLQHVEDKTRSKQISLEPRFAGACLVTLKRAAEASMGIVALPAFICRDEVRSGRLQRILPDWTAADSTITAVMPKRQGMSAATRAFIDHIAASFPRAVIVD